MLRECQPNLYQLFKCENEYLVLLHTTQGSRTTQQLVCSHHQHHCAILLGYVLVLVHVYMHVPGFWRRKTGQLVHAFDSQPTNTTSSLPTHVLLSTNLRNLLNHLL